MKRVFARIGMVLELSDDEHAKLLEECGIDHNGCSFEYDINTAFAERFVKQGVVDGDSYIPAGILTGN